MKSERPTVARMVRLLRQVREKGSFSQEQIARFLGVSCGTISRWERRRIKKVDPEMFKKLQRHSRLLDKVSSVLPAGGFEKFFFTRQAGLKGYAPIDLLGSDYGFDELLKFVEGSKAGEMS